MNVGDHGTHAAYQAGCRCDTCKAAKRDYIRASRSNARRRGFTGLNHGRISTYDAGCRCRLCRHARARRPEKPSSTHRYRTTNAPLATCATCGRDMALLAGGFLVIHGPYTQRCPGSHARPITQEQAA